MLLIEATARLIAEGVDCEVTIVGDGPMRGDAERLIDRLGSGGRVRVAGTLSNLDVRREIEASRALVLPSFAEGLPGVFFEAFALGRPVISTYIAGTPELVEPGTSGWLVPAGSVEAGQRDARGPVRPGRGARADGPASPPFDEDSETRVLVLLPLAAASAIFLANSALTSLAAFSSTNEESFRCGVCSTEGS